MILRGIEAVAGSLNEDIFERRSAQGDGGDHARKGGPQLGQEFGASLVAKADGGINNRTLDTKARANLLLEGVRLAGFDHNDITTDLSLQRLRAIQCDQSPLIENGEAIAQLSLIERVSGENNGEPLLGS